MHWLNRNSRLFIVSIFFLVGIFFIGFFLSRDQEFYLLSSYFICFCCYLMALYYLLIKQVNLRFSSVIIFAVFLRIALFFNYPNLSDDFFRFSWDGQICLSGVNPYKYLPENFHFSNLDIEHYANSNLKSSSIEFFSSGMNSKKYFSVYPPIAQLLFLICSYISGLSLFANVELLRLVFLMIEMLGWIYMVKLLAHFNLDKRLSFIYILNPLVIFELSGNLHLEGVALSFLIISLYFLYTQRTILSALFFSFSVGLKLLPIIIIPILFNHMDFKKFIHFSSVVMISCAVMFLPFLGASLSTTFLESILLYFNSFEFNGGLYSLFRAIGFYFSGYNQISFIGKLMPLCFVAFMAFLSFSKKSFISELSLPKKISLGFLVYLLLSSVVHPWYIIYLIGLAVFSGYIFPIAWSLVIFLSYFSYREINAVDESTFLIAVQYIVLLTFTIGDLKFKWAKYFFPKGENQELPV